MWTPVGVANGLARGLEISVFCPVAVATANANLHVTKAKENNLLARRLDSSDPHC